MYLKSSTQSVRLRNGNRILHVHLKYSMQLFELTVILGILNVSYELETDTKFIPL